LAWCIRAVRGADERDLQSGVLEFAHLRRLGETAIATGDLVDAVARLKPERSGEYLLALGGVRFARSLVETGLIDEYRIVQPIVPGAGERLFTTTLAIEAVSTTAFSARAVAHLFTAKP
jgi:dihydrofolate reductase